MSKILLLGVGPLPIENEQYNYALGMRTWQFYQALAKQNKVKLIILDQNLGYYNMQGYPEES